MQKRVSTISEFLRKCSKVIKRTLKSKYSWTRKGYFAEISDAKPADSQHGEMSSIDGELSSIDVIHG